MLLLLLIENMARMIMEWAERTREAHDGRTRVSNARQAFCAELRWTFPVKDGPDPITNRQYKRGDEIVSEYRYWPYVSLGRDAAELIEQSNGLLFDVSPRG